MKSSTRHLFEMLFAVSTSWIARLSAAIYTFVALPLILDVLGSGGFAIYLYATNFPTWLVLAMLGAQNSPAYFLSRARRSGDTTLLRVRLGTALLLPIGLVFLSTSITTALILFKLVGSDVASPQVGGGTVAALLTSLWLTAFLLIGGIFESMALGLGKAYLFNGMRIGALVLSLIGVFAAAEFSKSVAIFVFAQLAPQVILLFSLGSWMAAKAGVTPIFEWRFLRHIRSRVNASVASGFFLMALPFVFNVQLGPTIVGAVYGAAEVSTMLVLFRVLIFAASFFGAITATSWPLLGRMYTAGELPSLRRAAIWLIGGCTALLAVGFAFTSLFGGWALRLWLPGLELGDARLLVVFAAYLSLYLWNTLWLAILCATGRISIAGRLSAAEAVLGLVLGLLLFKHYHSVGYFVGLIIGTGLTTSLFAPIVGLRSLASVKSS